MTITKAQVVSSIAFCAVTMASAKAVLAETDKPLALRQGATQALVGGLAMTVIYDKKGLIKK